ncbi:PAS domain S-box protein [Rubrolithibacter danxiaensis]|uniref:PAS domain S-box protein n=1 Tax=Rubrolithibacter danxiaensis TaxID=3390805 RepID=UPI003BF888F5
MSNQNEQKFYKYIISHEVFQKFNQEGMLNILAIDAKGIITYANNSELAMLGYSANEYLGKPLNNFYTDTNTVKKIYDSASSEDVNNIESGILCKDGSIKFGLISTKKFLDETGLCLTYLFVRDITSYKKNEELLSYLNTAAEELSKARDTKTALNKISKLIVPRFANWFTIEIVKDEGIELLLLEHEDPKQVDWGREFRKKNPIDVTRNYGTALVLKTGQPSLVSVITDDMLTAGIKDLNMLEMVRNLGIQSLITVAMNNSKGISGIIMFISTTHGRHYDETDLKFAQNLANHIGLALENTKLNEEAQAEIQRRKQIEEELKKTQLQLNSALSSGLVGTWMRDLEKNILYIDESLSRIFGIEYNPNGHPAEDFMRIIHPDDRSLVRSMRHESIEKGAAYEAEYRIIRRDGEIRWMFTRGNTERNAEGNRMLYSGVVVDITERKRAQALLKESEELFRLMAETMPQKIFATDDKGQMLYLNPQWEQFTGFSLSEINRLTLTYFIHPNDLQKNLRLWWHSIATGEIFQFEHRILHKDGSYRWHLTRALPLRDEQGTILKWIGSITDIQDQKANEEKKDEFISIASHELKTPITSLRGYIQIMEKVAKKEGSPSILNLLEKTNRQAFKLTALVNDLLNVSKIQAGKINYTFSEFSVDEILEDALTDIKNNYPTHYISVKGDTSIRMVGDKLRLEQVLCNLLSNAAKYSPDSFEIILEVTDKADTLNISITDFGVGIPEEKVPFIFNRFYRVENTSYKFTGLGIGLYIASEIIKGHNGKISFTSVYGKGTTFSFSIPYKPLS